MSMERALVWRTNKTRMFFVHIILTCTIGLFVKLWRNFSDSINKRERGSYVAKCCRFKWLPTAIIQWTDIQKAKLTLQCKRVMLFTVLNIVWFIHVVSLLSHLPINETVKISKMQAQLIAKDHTSNSHHLTKQHIT